eukprot:TRINITY_DN1119_c1_g1_i1.p2 TRINITY_DN1119_c1_g1~~TRINITY_DN1119_c1_g1_i1.p2  ORF type:complete len:113 (+),score=31.69 TRINITY_DN1119_c1_g1_i1:169-507(+)
MACMKTFTVRRPAPVAVISKTSRVSIARNLRRQQLLVVAADPAAGQIEKAIEEAKEDCETGTAEECATSWDVVEEMSAAAAHKKAQSEANKDPLENFCKDNPETDECRVYED